MRKLRVAEPGREASVPRVQRRINEMLLEGLHMMRSLLVVVVETLLIKMLSCFQQPPLSTTIIAESTVVDDVEINAQVIPSIINAPQLFKTILSLGKGVLTSIDATVVNNVMEEVVKVSGNVPLIGVGLSALALIIKSMATAEDNKEKRRVITTHAEFLLKHLPELGEEESWQDELKKEIFVLCQQACILEHQKKKREGCIFQVCSWLGDTVSARGNAATLERVSYQLKCVHASFDTLLAARGIHLSPKYSALYVGEKRELIGMDSRKKEVMRFLNQPGIRVVGIYGLGGIGKTTLLRVVRREIQERKKHTIASVELGQDPSILALQQELAQQLSGHSIKFRDTEDGRGGLLASIKHIKDNGKEVCLILDNVWQDEHLEELMPHNIREALPPSSIVLMSSRPRQQAETFCRLCTADGQEGDQNNCKLYEPPLLNPQEAEILFTMKAGAGGKGFREAEYELVRRIVPLCGGLPLALEVYGSYFNNKKKRTREIWKALERRLKEAEDSPYSGEDKVFKRLEVSLELQTPALRQDFVDVALFWRGKPWDDAKSALTDENGDDHLLHLEDQTLVAEDELEKTVKVHDLMVALAIKHAKSHKAPMYVVDNDIPSQKEKLRGLSCTDTKVDMADLAKMSSLRFLVLENCRLQMNLMHRTYLLDKLFPAETTHRGRLFLLLMFLITSAIAVIVAHGFYARPVFLLLLGITLLLLLYLFSSHVSVPTFLCKDLTFLALKDCVNTINLANSIANLSNLRSLNLSHNHGFSRLPSSIFFKLTSLHSLNLSTCEELTKLPFVGHMTSLEVLDVSSCIQLQELPKSIGELGRLKKLDVSNCHRLAGLPETLGDLKGLETLKVSNCDALDKLPRSISGLASLLHLDLSCSDKLTRLPPSICNLMSVQTLDMSRCSGLKELPESLGSLSSLQTLILSHCESLAQLPTSIGHLISLKQLDLSFCDQLKELPTSIQYLTSLETLNITSCRKLQTMITLSAFLSTLPAEVIGLPKSSSTSQA